MGDYIFIGFFVILVLDLFYKEFKFKLDEFSTAVVMKGLHFALVKPMKVNNYAINYDMQFTESCRYDIGKDQSDWNKLIGIKQTFENPHDITMMIGWRYLTVHGVMELAPYQHDATLFPDTTLNRKMWGSDPHYIRRIPIGQTFNIKIVNRISDWEVSIDDEVVLYCKKTKGRGYNSWRILHWFGGNRSATHAMKIKYKVSKSKRNIS